MAKDRRTAQQIRRNLKREEAIALTASAWEYAWFSRSRRTILKVCGGKRLHPTSLVSEELAGPRKRTEVKYQALTGSLESESFDLAERIFENPDLAEPDLQPVSIEEVTIL
jgi:hypothetical protein